MSDNFENAFLLYKSFLPLDFSVLTFTFLFLIDFFVIIFPILVLVLSFKKREEYLLLDFSGFKQKNGFIAVFLWLCFFLSLFFLFSFYILNNNDYEKMVVSFAPIVILVIPFLFFISIFHAYKNIKTRKSIIIYVFAIFIFFISEKTNSYYIVWILILISLYLNNVEFSSILLLLMPIDIHNYLELLPGFVSFSIMMLVLFSLFINKKGNKVHSVLFNMVFFEIIIFIIFYLSFGDIKNQEFSSGFNVLYIMLFFNIYILSKIEEEKRIG